MREPLSRQFRGVRPCNRSRRNSYYTYGLQYGTATGTVNLPAHTTTQVDSQHAKSIAGISLIEFLHILYWKILPFCKGQIHLRVSADDRQGTRPAGWLRRWGPEQGRATPGTCCTVLHCTALDCSALQREATARASGRYSGGPRVGEGAALCPGASQRGRCGAWNAGLRGSSLDERRREQWLHEADRRPSEGSVWRGRGQARGGEQVRRGWAMVRSIHRF